MPHSPKDLPPDFGTMLTEFEEIVSSRVNLLRKRSGLGLIVISRDLFEEDEAYTGGEDNEVRREDQEKINRFSRLHQREIVLKDQLKAKQKDKEDLEEISTHRVDGNTSTLLTTIEYKPPHKLSAENLRAGLRPMEFWAKVVKPETIPTGDMEKLKYNAERLAGLVIVQEYHVMIQEGLEYSNMTNGLVLVLLRVSYDDPSTLYYYLFEPNLDVDTEDDQDFQQPKTAIARVLCLCLMSFRSTPCSQEWQLDAQSKLHTWQTSFAYTHSQIPEDELQRTPPSSEYLPLSPLWDLRRQAVEYVHVLVALRRV